MAIEEALLYDDLTGLPNRLLQRAHLEHALRRATRNGTHVAVLHLDVDDLEDLRERRGPEVADQVLIVLGARVVASLRGTDLVARVDHEQLAIVCEDLSDPRDLGVLTRRILDVARAPMRVGDTTVELRVSLGAALGTAADEAGELLHLARSRTTAAPPVRRAG